MEYISLMNSILIIGFIIYFLLNRKNQTSSVPNQTGNEPNQTYYKFDNSFSDYEKKLLPKLYEKFEKYTNNYIALDYILTTIWKESGSSLLKNIPNSNIIGDNGNSIGYFQIYKFGAFLEVNERENKNYTFEDLKDEQINCWFRIKYLSYCLTSALNQVKNKPLAWLVAKKYNGGLDETETSINNQAEKYADDYYSKYLKIQKFLKLNLG
jgi:hypothetical protein